jgi:hypothetical protein
MNIVELIKKCNAAGAEQRYQVDAYHFLRQDLITLHIRL